MSDNRLSERVRSVATDSSDMSIGVPMRRDGPIHLKESESPPDRRREGRVGITALSPDDICSGYFRMA